MNKLIPQINSSIPKQGETKPTITHYNTFYKTVISLLNAFANNNIENPFTPIINDTEEGWSYVYPTGKILTDNEINEILKQPETKGGKLFINGGAFDDNKVKQIHKIAAGIAAEVKNRAIYYDTTQSFESCPLIYNVGQDNKFTVNLIEYLYKFLYNPNLCMLLNKSGFNSREFIMYVIAKSEKFVSNPVYPDNNIKIKWNRINMKFSPKIKKFLGVNASTIKELVSDMNDNTENLDITTTDNNINNWTDKILSSTITKEEYKKYDKDNNPISNNFKDIVNESVSLFNNGSLLKPVAHNVQISDDMFLLSVSAPSLINYLYSPQKDIYNATIYTYSDIGAPTMLNFDSLKLYSEGKDIIMFYNFNEQLKYICDGAHYSNVNNKFSADMEIKQDDDNKDILIYHNIFKSVSDFRNPQFNPIYNFIQSLLQENINTVFFNHENLEFNNFGFDIGNTVKSNNSKALSGAALNTLIGGFNINDDFTNYLVNINDNLEGNKEIELLNTAYNLDGRNSTQNAVCSSKQLYSYIFRHTLEPSKCSNNVMFHLIVNYFHKYNISFNSMFNQLCFPSILFNAAGLRLSVKRVKSLIKEIEIPNGMSKEGYKFRLFDFIKFYLSNIVDDKGNISFDLAKDYKYQISFGDKGRSEQLRIEEVEKKVDEVTSKLNATNNTLALGNQYIAPSVANNFVVEFMKYIHINSANPIKNCEKIQSLFGSGIADALRHLDSLITFISVLFMLLKETSYYSHEYERDISYFNSENPDVFSIV